MEPRGGSTQPTRRRKRGDPLTPAQAVEAIRARVAANGSERLSLKGRTLDGPAAVRAACDAILALHPPTVTLNLTGAEVCSGGADALADFLMNERCAVEELCLVDNPRLGVHMADTGVAARDIPDRGEDEPVTDGGGTARARACARPKHDAAQEAQPRRLRPRRRSRGGARGGPRREGRVAVSRVHQPSFQRRLRPRRRRAGRRAFHPRRVPAQGDRAGE